MYGIILTPSEDVIAYRVLRPEPLQVIEASVGEGRLTHVRRLRILTVLGVLCGSIYLNKRFRQLLERKLAPEGYTSDQLESILDHGTKKFDHPIKTNFGSGGNDDEEVYMKLPGYRKGGICLTL